MANILQLLGGLGLGYAHVSGLLNNLKTQRAQRRYYDQRTDEAGFETALKQLATRAAPVSSRAAAAKERMTLDPDNYQQHFQDYQDAQRELERVQGVTPVRGERGRWALPMPPGPDAGPTPKTFAGAPGLGAMKSALGADLGGLPGTGTAQMPQSPMGGGLDGIALRRPAPVRSPLQAQYDQAQAAKSGDFQRELEKLNLGHGNAKELLGLTQALEREKLDRGEIEAASDRDVTREGQRLTTGTALSGQGFDFEAALRMLAQRAPGGQAPQGQQQPLFDPMRGMNLPSPLNAGVNGIGGPVASAGLPLSPFGQLKVDEGRAGIAKTQFDLRRGEALLPHELTEAQAKPELMAAQADAALAGAGRSRTEATLAPRRVAVSEKIAEQRERDINLRSMLQAGNLDLRRWHAEAANSVAEKKLVLDEAIQGKKLPPALVAKERVLRERIGRLEGQINRLQVEAGKSKDATVRQRLLEQAFILMPNLDGLTKELGTVVEQMANAPDAPAASGGTGRALGSVDAALAFARQQKGRALTPAETARVRALFK